MACCSDGVRISLWERRVGEPQLLLDRQGCLRLRLSGRPQRLAVVQPEGLAEVDPADLLVGGQLAAAFRSGRPRLP